MNARLILGVAAMTMAWPAAAQAADYGGGTAPDSVKRANRQLTLIAIRTADDGSGRLAVKVAAGCGLAKATRAIQLAADGSFRLELTARNRVPGEPGLRQRSRIALSGQIAGAVASGTVESSAHLPAGRPHGHAMRLGRAWVGGAYRGG